MIWCDVVEDLQKTISKFRTCFRTKIQHRLIPYIIDSLEQAFQLALDYERYLKLSISRKLSFQAKESMSRKFVESDRSTKVSNIAPTAPKVSSSFIQQPQNTKGKQVASEPSKQGSNNVRCYNLEEPNDLK